MIGTGEKGAKMDGLIVIVAMLRGIYGNGNSAACFVLHVIGQ